jgi:hypothetical protein
MDDLTVPKPNNTDFFYKVEHLLFCYFLSTSVSVWSQTPDLGMMKKVFYHFATTNTHLRASFLPAVNALAYYARERCMENV